MTPTNKAAVLTKAGENPMVVEERPYPTAGVGDIVVKVAAIAINPADWKVQDMGDKIFPWLKYPYVGGSDIAGIVSEVGPSVTRFKVGDRVVALADCLNDPSRGAFQEHVLIREKSATPIPDNLHFNDAVVLPLGLFTSSTALFSKDLLALDYPSLNPQPKNSTVLVWAGASSVGSNAVQLAVAAGYEVFTTASPKNFDACKQLGAAQVFDYKSPTVVQDIVEAFKGKTCVGAFAVTDGVDKVVYEIIAQTSGRKFVACSNPPTEAPEGIQARMLFCDTVTDLGIGDVLYSKYLPDALAQGKHQCFPKPKIVGQGIDKLQEGLNISKSGAVSAQKLIVTI